MTGNLHSIGAALQDAIRPAVAGHDVKIVTSVKTSTTIVASSPPIGQELISEFGLDFATQNRVFYIAIADLVDQSLGMPELNWKVIDESDDSVWRVLPQGDEYGWRWHGQNRTAIRLLTKQES